MATITWLQIFVAVFQLITSTSGTCNETNVGIRNELKVIPDAQMTASSNNGNNFLPEFGRLEGTSVWCPDTDPADGDPYLEINLSQKYDICGVEVQGLPGASVTTNFTLSYSSDNGSTFVDIQRFDGSAADGDVSDFHELPSIITTQFIRFKPVSTFICLRVEAYGTPEGVDVTCNENDILVEIDQSVHNIPDPSVLSLINNSCQATSNASFISFDITLGTCATRVVISTDGLKSFYRNTITSSADATEFEIICSYIREATFLGGGSGEFNFRMEIFTDDGFTTAASGTISLGTELYFKIEVETFGIDTEIHLTNCRATTSDDPDDPAAVVYKIIEDGCKVASDSIVTGYDCTTTTNIQTFDLSVFRFTGSTTGDAIYFHCQAVVCLTSNTGSICTTQCNDCTAGGKRKKRGLGDHSRNDLAEENLVLGPYQIIDNVDNDDAVGDGRTKAEDPSETIEDSKNFPVTMVIIVCLGSLVAIAIAIALFVTIRLSQSSRGLAVKDVTVDVARDNLAFDELDVKALSMKSNENLISS